MKPKTKKISQNYKPEKQNHTTHQILDQVAKGPPETAEQNIDVKSMISACVYHWR